MKSLRVAASAFAIGLLAAGLTAPAPALSQTLTIGLRSGTDALDPHFGSLGNSVSVIRNIYDTLVSRDETLAPTPSLAVAWKLIDDNIWEFDLRPGVKFHDGSDFTADDVKYTIERVPNAQGPTGGMMLYMTGISKVEVISPLKVRLITSTPTPLLPRNLAQIFILPKSLGTPTQEDFQSGKATIGTGPYKYVSWQPKGDLVVARHDAYWGGKQPWERIVMKEILADQSRVAALLAGDVDLINYVPSVDVEQLKKNATVAVFQTPSVYNFMVYPEVGRDQSPFVTDADGKPMTKNPMKDIRVRQAMSMAINRQAIVDRVMHGQGIAAGQLSPDGLWATSTALKPDKFDPDGAKKLLTEAGYPNGFGITLHCSSDRLPNDAAVCTALGGMLNRIGIKAIVAATPRAVFFPASARLEYSLQMSGWGSLSGETSYILQSLVHTLDNNKRLGANNRTMYSNPKLDALIETAITTVDDEKRKAMLIEAMEMSIKDYSTIPVVTLNAIWAGRKDKVSYAARNDEETNVLQMQKP
ncbi:ABC transporter substrate-binding protein [Bosea sp. NBC_00550]|uniref:ABC transporter substrate-binding protein n=1 Tax=Bosea sp. NBC_00550 TaxID=2969621 RepID=UPI002230FA2E|nr:ABC transporter substrate-binding protein [Bosea sp. NBC_00550]UZF94987.1 ABC transporter substrate-binding protein [Bosea sp. NBC_00550]